MAFCPGLPRVSRYQKGKTNLDFTGARDCEWQWNPLGHMQVCTLLHTDNHASTPPLSFLQAACPSCCPTNSIQSTHEWESICGLKSELFSKNERLQEHAPYKQSRTPKSDSIKEMVQDKHIVTTHR